MSETREVLRVAVLGAGGLGAAATRMLAIKREMTHVGIADSRGVAFDAEGLLNPGKVYPILHRCAELGRLHVRAGQVRFPDIPRF